MKESEDEILNNINKSLNLQEKEKSVNSEANSLNLFDIFTLGLGGAVGSGIFVLMGEGIKATGNSIVLAVVGGVFFMLLAYFYNLLLSSMFVFEGGDYSQKAIAFNPIFTGVGAYVTFVNGFGIAMYSVAIIEYAGVIFPEILPHTKIVAIAIITLLFAATRKGSKFISIINNIMTVILIVSLGFFVVFGVPQVKPGFFSNSNFFRNGFPGLIAGISVMGWATQGTTMGPVAVSAASKNPKRNIPLGIIIVCLVLSIIYGLVSYVAAGVLPYEQVAGESLAIVSDKIFPNWIFIIFILGGAVFAIFTSMITSIQMVRYPILKVAQDGWLPEVFTKTKDDGYPWVVYLLFYILSIIPVLAGFSLDVIVSLVMIPAMLMNVYLNIACIKIIKENPKQWKDSILNMPIWLIDIICVVAAICAAVVGYNLFMSLSVNEKIIMSGILIFIFVLSWYRLKIKAVSKESLELEKTKMLENALKYEKSI